LHNYNYSYSLKQHCINAIKSGKLEKNKNKLSLIAVSFFLLCFAVVRMTGNWNLIVTNEEYAHIPKINDKLVRP
jgi:hypothetical protein